MAMKSKANRALSLPQSKRSGTSTNSKVFIVATMLIWAIALSLVLNLDHTQTAIAISEIPISIVKGLAWASSNMLATISSCRGTKFRALQ